MPDNIVQVGATFDGAALNSAVDSSAEVTEKALASMQASFDELKAQSSAAITALEAKLAEMEEAFKSHGSRSNEALAGIALGAESAGIGINRHLRSMIAEIPGVSAAFETLLPVFAITAGVEILGEVIKKIDEIANHTELEREAWLKVQSTSNDVTEKIIEAIEAQRVKFLELSGTGGPIAALEFEFKNLRTVALSSFADVSSTMTAFSTQFAKDGGWFTGLGRANKNASADLNKTLGDMQEAMQKAIKDNPGHDLASLLAPITAQQTALQKAIADAEGRLSKLGNVGKGVNLDMADALNREIAAYNDINGKLELQKQLQQEIFKTKKEELDHAATDKSITTNIADVDGTKKQFDAVIQEQQQALRVLHENQSISDEDFLTLNKALITAKYTQDENALQDKIAQLKRDPERNAAQIISANAEAIALGSQKNAALEKLDADYYKTVDRNAKEAVNKAAENNKKLLANIRETMEERMRTVADTDKAEIELAEQNVEKQYDLGQINKQQEIAMLADLKQQELTVDINYQKARLQLYQAGSKEYAKIEEQITKDKNEQEKIRAKADTDEANNFSAQIKRQLKDWQDVSKQMSQAYMGMINGFNSSLSSFIVTGQGNWTQLATSALKSIATIGLQWAESYALMAITDKIGAKNRIQNQVDVALDTIEINADVAASTAYAAYADIPPLAATMASAAYGATIAWGGAVAALASFDIGTNFVPMDGLAMLHKGETIIPASAQGPGYSGSSGVGAGGVHFHFSPVIQAMDSTGVDAVLTKHRNRITNEVKKIIKRNPSWGR